jgi:hypothetical protein
MNILEKRMKKHRYKKAGVATTRVVGPIVI